MDDWSKALLTAGLGFGVGIAVEPFKLWLTTWANLKAARIALYRDMGRVYYLLNRFWDVCRETKGEKTTEPDQQKATEWLRSSQANVFNYYSSTNQAVFFRIPENAAITRAYKSISDAVAAADQPWADRYSAVRHVFEVFDTLFKSGELNEKLLLKHRAKHRERGLAQIQQYHSTAAQENVPLIRDSQLTGTPLPRILGGEEKK
jgi:hypothetical protein